MKTTILPAVITGNAKADAAIRYGAMAIGTSLVGVGVGWAKAHGFKVPDKDTLDLYAQIASGVVVMVAAFTWGQHSVGKNEATVIASTIQAAATGEVPAAIAARATPAQAQVIAKAAVVAAPPTHK